MEKQYRIVIEIESEDTMTDKDKEALISKVASEVNDFIEEKYPDMSAIVSVSELSLVESEEEADE